MSERPATQYGADVADLYDRWFAGWLGTAPVDLLAALAGAGPALELGIGTGRIAVPLQERGVEVHGVDASEPMVARLRDRPGGDRIAVSIGDFSEFELGAGFTLVYVVAGTFFELPGQEAQVRCFASAARALRPGGVFVLDGLVPERGRMLAQQGRVIHRDAGGEVLQFREYDTTTQRLVSHYLVIADDGIRHLPITFRYAAPGELDLMARLAGLRLGERWGGWQREPFTSESTRHVSVYELPG